MIDISIIMPVYNSGRYLESAVDSILKQSLTNIEIILIDDGSTDDTYSKCLAYAKQDDRVKVYHQENKGICSARNLGISKAKGEYIGFCDHDDIYLPGLLEACIKTARNENSDIVKYGYRFETVDANGLIIGEAKIVSEKSCKVINENTWRDFKLFYNSISAVWNGIYKRNLIVKENIKFDERIKFGLEDICFGIDIYRRINRISFIEEEFYIHYKRTNHSTSAKYNFNRIESEKIRWDKINNLFSNLKGSPDKELISRCIFDQVNSISGQLCHKSCDLSLSEKKSILEEFNVKFISVANKYNILENRLPLSFKENYLLNLFINKKYVQLILAKKLYYLFLKK